MEFININNNQSNIELLFNPLSEASFNTLKSIFNEVDLLPIIINYYNNKPISIECVNNKYVIQIVKSLLLNGYSKEIKLEEYNINDIDHAIIFVLNKMIISLQEDPSRLNVYQSFRELILNTKIETIVELIVYAQESIIDENNFLYDILYYFNEYGLYFGLINGDKDIINYYIERPLNSRDLILIYSVSEISIDYINLYLKSYGTENKKFNIKDVEIKTSTNEVIDKEKLMEYLLYLNKNKFTDSQWLMIFKQLIISNKSATLDYIITESTFIFEKYFKLLKLHFFEMFNFHATNIDKKESLKKFKILFDNFVLDEDKKAELYCNLIKYINYKMNEKNFISFFHQITNNLLFAKSYITLNDYLYKIVEYLINYSQFLDIDNLLNFYTNLNQDLLTLVFKNKNYNNNGFYLHKSNILINKLINSITNNEKEIIYKILSNVNKNDNKNVEIITGNNQTFLDQCDYIEEDINDPIFIEEQRQLLLYFNIEKDIIPPEISDGFEIFQFLFYSGNLKEFNLEILIGQLLSLNLYKKEKVFEFLSSNRFIKSQYNNGNFDYNTLERYISSEEYYIYFGKKKNYIQDISQLDQIENDDIIEFGEDEYNYESEDEDNEDYQISVNDSKNSIKRKDIINQDLNEIQELIEEFKFDDDGVSSDGSIGKGFLLI